MGSHFLYALSIEIFRAVSAHIPPNAQSISVVANTIHRAAPHDPLSDLNSARWSLEGKSDFWGLVLQISTVAIGVGVFVEVVATVMEIIEDRAEGKKLPPFDIFGMQDTDAEAFMSQIADAAQKAGWDWKPAPSIGALVFTPQGKPQMGIVVSRGCSIEIAESARPTLTNPVLALVNGIVAAGIPCRASANNDSTMLPEYDKKWVHVFIGTRD